MDTITLKKYREIFGFPVKNYYLKLGFDLDAEPFEKSGLEFIREYGKRRYEAQLYPEVISLLNELSNIGITHSILSAQHQEFLDDLTNHYNIRRFFLQVIGLNNHYASSKIDNGKRLVTNLDIDLKKVLMIGDTEHDYEVANAIGIDCLLLSHGHHNHSRLQNTTGVVMQNLFEVFHFFGIALKQIGVNQD